MRAKSMILILIAGGCGLVASIGISQVMNRQGGNSTAMEMTRILVAARDLNIGDKLDAQSLNYEEWPKEKVPQGAMTDLEKVKDMVPNTRLFKGEPLLHKKLIDNMADSLPPIPPGYRVVPVKVNESTAPSLLLPGDKVDILVFLRHNNDVDVTQTRTVLQDVRVFAVNSQTQRVVEDGQQINVKTVQVLVKPNQVEMLMLAMEMGPIRLSLRGHNDPASVEHTGTDITSLIGPKVERANDAPKKESKSDLADMLKSKQDALQAGLAQMAQAGPAKQMMIFGPDTITQYTWHGAQQLPDARELRHGASVAPAFPGPQFGMPAAAPPASPDQTPAAGADKQKQPEPKPWVPNPNVEMGLNPPSSVMDLYPHDP